MSNRLRFIALFFGLMLPSTFFGCRPESSQQADSSVSPQDSTQTTVEASLEDQVQAVANGQSKIVQLAQARPTGAELATLSQVPALLTLQLDLGVSDPKDLFSLPKLDALNHLRIRETVVDDEALAHIVRSFSNLAILNLPTVELTASSHQALKPLAKLNSLRLGGNSVDRSFLEQLVELPKLRHLHLIRPQLVDDDLTFIASLESLQSFYLDECDLSDQAWQEFFSTRPNLHVHLDQYHHDRDPGKHPH